MKKEVYDYQIHQPILLPKINRSFHSVQKVNPFHLTQNRSIHQKKIALKQQKIIKFKKSQEQKIWQKSTVTNSNTMLKQLKQLEKSIIYNQIKENEQQAQIQLIKKKHQSSKTLHHETSKNMIEKSKSILLKSLDINQKLQLIENYNKLSQKNIQFLHQAINQIQENGKNFENFIQQQKKITKQYLQKISKQHTKFLQKNQISKGLQFKKKELQIQVNTLKEKNELMQKYQTFLNSLIGQVIILKNQDGQHRIESQLSNPQQLICIYDQLEQINFSLIEDLQIKSEEYKKDKKEFEGTKSGLQKYLEELKQKKQKLEMNIKNVDQDIFCLQNKKLDENSILNLDLSNLFQQFESGTVAVVMKNQIVKVDRNIVPLLNNLQNCLFDKLKTIDRLKMQDPQLMRKVVQKYVSQYRHNKKNDTPKRIFTKQQKKEKSHLRRMKRKIMERHRQKIQNKQNIQLEQSVQDLDYQKYFS